MDLLEALDDNDETRSMVQFYESHLEFFKTCPVYSLRPSVYKTVAVMLHSKFYFESEWQEYASEMGITDNLHLAVIQESAKASYERPMFITMRNALERVNGNLANIIKTFLKTNRYDVLAFLEPHVKKLLEKIPDTVVKGFGDTEQNIPCLKDKNLVLSSETTEEVNCETVSSLYNIYTQQSDKAFSTELDPTLITKLKAFEINALSKNSECGNTLSELNQIQQHSNLSSLSCEENSLQDVLPSAPPEERLSVLIQHTECDYEVAKQLCGKLREGGIATTTLFDMESLIRMDPTGALSKVFQEVDFIVPVVSLEFLQQIDPQYCGSYDAKSNRTLYQLITNEYQHNSCVNFRVRPVVVPGMKRCKKLTDNVILAYSFRLWNECEKLIRVLNETKELMKRYRSKMKIINT